MIYAKFGWNWLCGYGEENFLILSMYFRYFAINSPWKRAGSFIWNKLNPLHLRMLCAKFGWNWLWFLRRRFFNFVNVFSLFRNYFPLEKGRALHLNKIESFYPRMLCAKFGPVVLEKKIKMWKVYKQTTDERWLEKLTWAFSSDELKKTLCYM